MSADRISIFFSRLGDSAKSIVKLLLQSRSPRLTKIDTGETPLIILGNGPSLRDNIENNLEFLRGSMTMAVNFAANADEFTALCPNYYILADPHFFEAVETDPNVSRLFDRISSQVDWDMTLFIPVGREISSRILSNPRVKVEKFNFLGIEGFEWLENAAYSSGRGMPRPRNVLIPAIMVGLQIGFREIVIIGADHTWTRTLSVDDENHVISVQPHFYKDNSDEKARVTSVYRDVRLHDVLMSMCLAFKSYHSIARYAGEKGVRIFNATPGSFIDAFPRKKLI